MSNLKQYFPMWCCPKRSHSVRLFSIVFTKSFPRMRSGLRSASRLLPKPHECCPQVCVTKSFRGGKSIPHKILQVVATVFHKDTVPALLSVILPSCTHQTVRHRACHSMISIRLILKSRAQFRLDLLTFMLRPLDAQEKGRLHNGARILSSGEARLEAGRRDQPINVQGVHSLRQPCRQQAVGLALGRTRHLPTRVMRCWIAQ